MKGFTILWVLLLSGCASGPIGRLPVIKDYNQTGDVFVIRDSNFLGSGVSLYITLDGNDIFAIRIGQYTKFGIVSGEHLIGVKCFGGWTPTWKEDSKRFSILPQQELYFIVSPSMSCADIQPISPELGKEWINKTTYISMQQADKPIINKETEAVPSEDSQKTLETLENDLKRLEKMKSEGSLTEEEYLKLKNKAVNGF